MGEGKFVSNLEIQIESGLSGHDKIAVMLLPTLADGSELKTAPISGVILSPP